MIDASESFKKVNHSAYAVSIRNSKLVGKIESPTPSPEIREQLDEKLQYLQATKRVFKWTELAKHNTKESLYLSIHGKVYDLTKV